MLLCGVIMAGTLIVMLLMNWKLAIIVGTLLIAKSIHTVKVNRAMKKSFRKNRVKAGEVSARAEEKPFWYPFWLKLLPKKGSS